jgi:hypothetical protein
LLSVFGFLNFKRYRKLIKGTERPAVKRSDKRRIPKNFAVCDKSIPSYYNRS